MSKDIQDKQVLKEKYIINKLKKVLPVKCSKHFNLDVSELWKLISAPGNLNDSHPFCSKNEVIVWDETNHIDKLLYLNEDYISENLKLGKKIRDIPYLLVKKMVLSLMLFGK